MKPDKKNNEVSSRREFFKQAAKKVLPMLGIVTIMTLPTLQARTIGECNDCTGGCGSSCSYGCDDSCKGRCKDGCYGCTGGCSSLCKDACNQNCSGNSNM